jgi:hypothetical protein
MTSDLYYIENGLIWRPIENTPYLVSENGDVIRTKPGVNGLGGSVLRHRILPKGYHRVLLCYDGRNIDKYIHRLVAEAFIKNPRGYKEVNHKDGDKSNNNYLNLEWVSHRQNHQHAAINYLTNPERSLNEEAVKVIKWVLKNMPWITHSKLASLYKVNRGTITDINTGRSWRYVTI